MSQDTNFYSTHEVKESLDVPLKDRFKILLRRKALTQSDLADLIGVSKGLVSQIINGKWFPSSKLMIQIARHLDCDSVVIFGDQPYWKTFSPKIIYPEEEKKNG